MIIEELNFSEMSLRHLDVKISLRLWSGDETIALAANTPTTAISTIPLLSTHTPTGKNALIIPARKLRYQKMTEEDEIRVQKKWNLPSSSEGGIRSVWSILAAYRKRATDELVTVEKLY